MSGKRARETRGSPWLRAGIAIGAFVVLGLLILGGVLFLGVQWGSTPLEDAAEACSVGSNTVRASGGGASLTVASGDDRTGWQATIMSVCVLTELEVSDAVRSEIEGTAPGTAQQSDSWDEFEVAWTYDADDGLEIVVETLEGRGDEYQRA